MANLNDRRAQIVAKQQRTSAKISRTKRQNGADIAGTEYDPRMPASRISRMTGKQLDALEGRLDAFNHRRTQFYGGAKGKVITATQKRRLEYAESEAYRARLRKLSEYSRTLGPGGRPLTDRMRMVAKRSPRKFDVVNNPFNTKQRLISNVGNPEDLISRYRDESRSDFFDRLAEKRREEYKQMAEVMAIPRLLAAVDELTPKQFFVLWHMTEFPELISSSYEGYKSGENIETADPQSQLAQEVGYAIKAIDWAKGQPS